MKKHIFYFVMSVCPVFPALSLFSFGLVFVLEFCLFFLCLLGVRETIPHLRIKDGCVFLIEIPVLLLTSAFFVGFLKIVLPTPAVLLEFYLYVAPFSYMIFDSLVCSGGKSGAATNSDGYPPILTGFVFLSAFSLAREFLYYGTVSLPVFNEIIFTRVLPHGITVFTRFWGSFPGAMILTGMILALFNFIDVKSKNAPNAAS